MAIDIVAARNDTPGCRHRIHFNNAGASLMPQPVMEAVVAHLERESQLGGYEAADAARDRIDGIYRSAARLLNCRPAEIALFENATRAWDAIFYAIPFKAGERIVTGKAEYCSNYMAYLQVAREFGVEINVIGNDAHGQLDVEELRDTVDERVTLISLTHVPTSGGLVNPAAAVGKIAREHDTLFLLDACQSVGQMPIDVEQIGCDFLTTTGRKFLRGPRGTGFAYINRTRLDRLQPRMVEVGSGAWTAVDGYTLKPDARRFETWEASYALQLGLGRAIDYALALGISAIWDCVSALAAELRRRLAAIDRIAVHDLGAIKCGIVTFTVRGVASQDLLAELRGRSINVDVSTAEDTRLDFEDRKLPPMVRASVHYFNTLEEIDEFCGVVTQLSRQLVTVREGQ
jgi:cysteine desulfurase / selenocysteine lyase